MGWMQLFAVDNEPFILPSQNCRFGPKAQLFEPPAGDQDQDASSLASSVAAYHDPGNTRLNWYTTPQSVLVIKKPRDHDVLEPFVSLIRCLLRVSRSNYHDLPRYCSWPGKKSPRGCVFLCGPFHQFWKIDKSLHDVTSKSTWIGMTIHSDRLQMFSSGSQTDLSFLME